jgi:glycosyltransferase involved in cell wall biosynthesis
VTDGTKADSLDIALDMTFANRNRGGSGVYARSLLAALRNRDLVTVWEISGPSRSNVPGTMSWLVQGARRALTTRMPDVLHCPSFVAPWRVPVPFVVTVHDAGGRRFPGDHPLEWRVYDRAVLAGRLRAAARVITGSSFARAELISEYGLPDDRVAVIPYGVDARYFQAVPPSSNGNGFTMLFPGAPVPRKNLDAVLQCMAAAAPGSALGSARLDISGARPDDFRNVAAQIASLRLDSRVRWLGHVPAEQMPAVIARSSVVVYPSLSEGFGFPLLEALAVGTPAVGSDRGSIPEVVGDSAVLIDPTDRQALSDALESVLTQPELRARLKRTGQERARTYTWDRCADMTLDIYRSVLKEAGAQ